MTTMESEKYLEPHFSNGVESLIDYLFNNSSTYKIPEDFILRRRRKMRELKKMQFSRISNYWNKQGSPTPVKEEPPNNYIHTANLALVKKIK